MKGGKEGGRKKYTMNMKDKSYKNSCTAKDLIPVKYYT
jgi:hypothetical protein